jgi:hypothetical protein
MFHFKLTNREIENNLAAFVQGKPDASLEKIGFPFGLQDEGGFALMRASEKTSFGFVDKIITVEKTSAWQGFKLKFGSEHELVMLSCNGKVYLGCGLNN